MTVRAAGGDRGRGAASSLREERSGCSGPESEIHSFPSTFSSVCPFIQHTLNERPLIYPLLGGQQHPGSGRLWGWTAAPTCTRPRERHPVF